MARRQVLANTEQKIMSSDRAAAVPTSWSDVTTTANTVGKEVTMSMTDKVSCIRVADHRAGNSEPSSLAVAEARGCRSRPCGLPNTSATEVDISPRKLTSDCGPQAILICKTDKVSCTRVAVQHSGKSETNMLAVASACGCPSKPRDMPGISGSASEKSSCGRSSWCAPDSGLLAEKSKASPVLRTTQFKLSRYTARVIQSVLEEELLRAEARISILHHKMGFIRARDHDGPKFAIDKLACESLSKVICTYNMSLEDATQFVRGESGADSRPNKAIDTDRLRAVLHGYQHLDALVQIAEKGIDVEWKQGPRPRRPPPKNHGSCRRYMRAVTRSIRTGQDTGQYMVVNPDILERWSEVICSPFGAVEKKDVSPSEEVRIIHDLSYPPEDSVNAAFVVESVPPVRYESVAIIARRIEDLHKAGHVGRIRILKGDVKSAFRHLRIRANQVFRMAAYVKELGALVIDMAAPFGWAGSPPCYALFGRAITWLMGSNSPSSVSDSSDDNRFFPYEWVDDHILIEPDTNNRLELAEATLRHAMLAVLGPRSINESKFSKWSVEIVALGLRWNTDRRTVSIPEEKIVKARQRVITMKQRGTASKSELFKLLGSLRHVATCLRTARPFYQRLQSQCIAAPRFGRIHLSNGAKTDLVWFLHILNHGYLAELPLTMFGTLPPPHVELYMDASNIGLAVLDPACNSFIQVKFDAEEKPQIDCVNSSEDSFSINVREHLCIALALWTWGSKWCQQALGRTIHVKCWTNNASAVGWCNRLHSSNAYSQEINRAIGLAEVYFNLRVSAGHIAGTSNWMADAASRAWTEPFKAHWTNFSMCWMQTPVPPKCRKNLHQLLENLQSKSLATTSKAKYASTWTQWCTWCARMQFSKWLPEDPQKHSYQLALFATYCWQYGWGQFGTGNAASTVLSKVSHVAWHHRRMFGYTVKLLPGHQLAITGMRRVEPPRKPKSPVTTDILRQLHQQLDFSDAQHRVLWGASVLGFFFLLRRSEYLAKGLKIQSHALQRADVKFVDKTGSDTQDLDRVGTVVLHFRGSKADQFGVGATRALARSGQRWCCPVLAAWYLVRHHESLGVGAKTLLCKIDALQNLQVNDVVWAIKSAARQIGQDPRDYASHSLRSGGATALFNAGFDSLAVKLFGRWKSDAVERYTRISSQLTSRMASQMLLKPSLYHVQGVSPTPGHPGSGGAKMQLRHHCADRGTPPKSSASLD